MPDITIANILDLWALYYECTEAAQRGDSESAHIAEDRLREETLNAICAGSVDPEAASNLALSTSYLTFERWHA
jgi:hypothetical protein